MDNLDKLSREELINELLDARATNRKLNRRNQELESFINSELKRSCSEAEFFSREAARAHSYANELRDHAFAARRHIHDYYWNEIRRLPKPQGISSWQDTPKARIDEALKLISQKSSNSVSEGKIESVIQLS